MLGGGVDVAVWGEPEVDGHDALVGDDVAGDATGNANGRQTLAIHAAVDVDRARLVCGQPRQHRRGRMDRVVTEPRPCAVRSGTGESDLSPHCALAAGLNGTRRALEHDGEVGRQYVRPSARQAAEAVSI